MLKQRAISEESASVGSLAYASGSLSHDRDGIHLDYIGQHCLGLPPCPPSRETLESWLIIEELAVPDVLTKLLLLSLAGATGTLARYGMGFLVQSVAGISFPWGTLVINVSGSFLYGLVWALGVDEIGISAQARTVLLVGFMGAYTTFSTFAFETGDMIQKGQYLFAGLNLALQNLVGIACLIIGLAAGKALLEI